MANLLVLNGSVPFPAHYTGNATRLFPLCTELSKRYNLYLAVFEDDPERLNRLRQTNVFKDILVIPQSKRAKNIWRYLFLRSGHSDRRSRPGYHKRNVGLLKDFATKNQVDLVLSFGQSEYGASFSGYPKIIDETDCLTLTLQRAYSHMHNSLSLLQRLEFKARIYNAIYRERDLTKQFDFVTTISPADRAALAQVNRQNQDRIVVVPNGVRREFFMSEPEDRDELEAVAFWGALYFSPNREAIRFFYEDAYLKYLQNSEVKWFIIGSNQDEIIAEMGRKHKNIVVTGFVDNLPGLVSRIPIMINPMKTGSGLKNKVIEAFALGKLVISTEMGVQGLEARDGVHYVQADTGQEFAQAISHFLLSRGERKKIAGNARRLVAERYTWEKVSEGFHQLIDMALKGAA
jgi:glycosyltransferase involved in cell wall biosynthesis